MTVTVLYFASLSDLMGTGQQTLDLPRGSTVAQLLEALEQTTPGLRAYERRYRVAQNQEFVTLDVEVQEGAEIALIPPVSGG